MPRRSPSKSAKPARVKIGPAKVYPDRDLFRQVHLKEEKTRKPIEKPTPASPQKEKVKLEELDKKLEEILKE